MSEDKFPDKKDLTNEIDHGLRRLLQFLKGSLLFGNLGCLRIYVQTLKNLAAILFVVGFPNHE